MPYPNGYSTERRGVSVVIGGQWGDEGKGKLVDLLSENADVVCRCQGGNNAGHTVISNGQEFFFHILPSGLINPDSLGLIGNGTVVHLPGLFEEIEECVSKGLLDVSKRIRISNRCHVVCDIHQTIDRLEEELRGSSSIGTTKKGIGPTYSSKIIRNGIRMCDLVGDWSRFVTKYTELVNYASRRYPKLTVNIEDDLKVFSDYRERLSTMVCDTVVLINRLVCDPECSILVEGAQSCMLDVDFGTYPHVTSSNCTVGGVCTGLGLPPSRIGPVYGVIKAYTTRVGSGPFPTELLNDVGAKIQQVGREWGVTTKRRRRVGWLDTVIVRYAHMINDFTALALTKIDVLDGLDEVLVGRAYIDTKTGEDVSGFPADSDLLSRVTVVYETFPGWNECTQDCTSFYALPQNAQNYVLAVERICGIPIRWIGTGASRNSMIVRAV